MRREVTDGEGRTWVCVQAYAGLAQEGEEKEEAKAAADDGGRVEVVCTPSGGARTVRLRLESGWQDSYTDEALLGEIESNG